MHKFKSTLRLRKLILRFVPIHFSSFAFQDLNKMWCSDWVVSLRVIVRVTGQGDYIGTYHDTHTLSLLFLYEECCIALATVITDCPSGLLLPAASYLLPFFATELPLPSGGHNNIAFTLCNVSVY